MAQIPFISAGYTGRSMAFESSRSVNFYPELATDPNSKGVACLVGTPGLNLFCAQALVPVRGMHVFNGKLYVVDAGQLFSLDANGAKSASLGTLDTNSGMVSMADNGVLSAGIGGNQLMIVDGTSGYILNVNTSTFTVSSSFTGGGFPANPIQVTYIDSYFVVTNGTMNHYVSDIFNGLNWNALATGPVQAATDFVQAPFNLHQQLWFIKQSTTEVFYDTGTATSLGSPFSRYPGAVIDYGTPSPWSVTRGDNSLFFLANQRTDGGPVFVGVAEMNGYTPQIISPPAITYQMSLWTDFANAFAYSYSDGGHTFVIFTSPGDNQTFVYDTTTQLWHERSSYTDTPYVIGRHLSNCYASFNGKHYVGDFTTGNVYEMSSLFYSENGNPIVSMRIVPHVADKNDLDDVYISRLIIDSESGVGDPTAGLTPQAVLSWSKDGGKTWSGDYPSSMGASGQYVSRLIWKRLGMARDKVFRLTCSDPVKKVFISCAVEAD